MGLGAKLESAKWIGAKGRQGAVQGGVEILSFNFFWVHFGRLNLKVQIQGALKKRKNLLQNSHNQYLLPVICRDRGSHAKPEVLRDGPVTCVSLFV